MRRTEYVPVFGRVGGRDQPLQAFIFYTRSLGPEGVRTGPVLLKTGVTALEGEFSLEDRLGVRIRNPTGLPGQSSPLPSIFLFPQHSQLVSELSFFNTMKLFLARPDSLHSIKIASSWDELLPSFSRVGCQLPTPTRRAL